MSPRPPWAVQATTPSTDIFAADLSAEPQLASVLEELAIPVGECVAFGTTVFKWALEAAGERSQEAGPELGTGLMVAILRFRGFLDMLSCVDPLLRVGAADGAKVNLRAAFEQSMYLQFLLEDSVVDRAHAFLHCEQRDKLAFYDRVDPDTNRGKEVGDRMREEGLDINFPPELIEEREGDRERIRGLFDDPPTEASRRARDEYVSTKKRLNRSSIPWYAFKEGPANIRELAIALGRGTQYEFFYKYWSGTVHGSDILRRFGYKGDVAEVPQLRHPEDAQQVTLHAISLALGTMRTIIEHFVPDREKDLATWYLNIRPAYQAVAGPPLITIVDP